MAPSFQVPSIVVGVLASVPLAGCLTTLDGGPQGELAEPVGTTQSKLCAGRTPVGATEWQADSQDVVHVDIDTSACGMTGRPLYFTSLGGEGYQYTPRGVTSIYRHSQRGFRVVLVRPDAELFATSKAWHVNWMARPEGLVSNRLCTGRTDPAQFETVSENGIRVKVDLSHCGFSEPPVLMTSLGGAEGHALTRGATSLYWSDAKGFAVFIQREGITSEQAADWGWHINWSAMPEAHDGSDFCAGRTTGEQTPWLQYGKHGLKVRLATGGCDAPLVFTSLGGEHSHWWSTGASSVYEVTPEGFVVRLNRYRATPEWAQRENWHVHWTRVTPTIE